MSGQNLIRAAVTVTTGLLLGITSASAQEFPEPIPSTPNPAGSILPPENADGVVPARDVDSNLNNAGDADTVPRAERRQTAPLTAVELQTWQQIAALHEQFVRSQVRGVADAGDISRTDPNRQRLQQLWERLAEIERQLILTGAYNEIPAALSVTVRPGERPLPRRDLDEVPDPLTATNQRVPSSANDQDQSTARALAQEDRSPAANPPPSIDIPRGTSVPQQAELEVEAVRRARPRLDVDPAAEDPVPDTGSLWQEFIEVRRQILIAEIAAARTIANQE